MRTSLGLFLVIAALRVVAADGEYPPTPAAVVDIVYARPFRVQEGYRSYWHGRNTMVTRGYMVVLVVDPALREPRASGMPVLLSDSTVMEMFNFGNLSGKVVAVVPNLDSLTGVRMWFGPVGCADQMNPVKIEASRAEAVAHGIQPFSPERIAAALSVGGETLVVSRRAALVGEVLALVGQYDVH